MERFGREAVTLETINSYGCYLGERLLNVMTDKL